MRKERCSKVFQAAVVGCCTIWVKGIRKKDIRAPPPVVRRHPGQKLFLGVYFLDRPKNTVPCPQSAVYKGYSIIKTRYFKPGKK